MSAPAGKIRSGGFKASRGPYFGPIQQTFDEVWWTWGSVKVGPGISFSRGMTVVREKGELVIVNSVMMPPAQQAQIDALGPVKHVVRLGCFHGMDDALYVERYKPTVWAPPEVELNAGVRVDHELTVGGPLPIEGATLFDFSRSRSSEQALLLPRYGGVLLTCDSVQNWETRVGCSLLGGWMSSLMGFRGRAIPGPGWRRIAETKEDGGLAPDFERLLGLDFKHAIGGHGEPMKDTAKESLRTQLKRIYGARF